jgi:high-affinity iron transporter
MLPIAVLIFREVLEAALIISIVCAATRGVPGRTAWVTAGVGAGIIGAIIVAVFAETIMQSAAGLGQEILNAIILFLAVLMLAWHNIWMASHARELTAQMKAVGTAVREGRQELLALLVVVGLAVLREGSEIVLFVYGVFAGGTQTSQMLAGSVAGLAAGAGVGFALYFGLLRIPTRHLFTVTGCHHWYHGSGTHPPLSATALHWATSCMY